MIEGSDQRTDAELAVGIDLAAVEVRRGAELVVVRERVCVLERSAQRTVNVRDRGLVPEQEQPGEHDAAG